MSLIRQVLAAVQKNGSVVSLDELSRQVGIQPAALQSILNFCAQKGYLILDSAAESGCTSCASAAGCAWGCGINLLSPQGVLKAANTRQTMDELD